MVSIVNRIGGSKPSIAPVNHNQKRIREIQGSSIRQRKKHGRVVYTLAAIGDHFKVYEEENPDKVFERKR